jgi:hypothetical protein
VPLTQVKPELVTSINRLGLGTVLETARFGGDTAISPLMVHQSLVTLHHTAHNETYDLLGELLGSDRSDIEIDGHMALWDHLLSMKGRPFTASNSFWTIWPIFPSRSFASDAESHLGIHVEKLGTAGPGSIRTLNKWVEKQSGGRVKRMVDSLDIDQIYINTMTADLTLALSSDGAQATAGEDVEMRSFRDADGRFTVRQISGSSSAILALGEADLQGLIETSAPAEITPPSLSITSQADLQDGLKVYGFETIFDGPVSLIDFSTEMEGDYGMGAMLSNTALNLKGSEPVVGPNLVLVYEEETGAMVFAAAINLVESQ